MKVKVYKSLAFAITEDMLAEGLKGNELVVFAYIYYKCGRSIEGCYNEGISGICKIFGLSEPTVIRIVKNLVEYKFIEKTYFTDKNNQKRCSLRVLF